MQTPSIGRIVHYQSYGTPGGEYLPEPRAAIITEVEFRGIADHPDLAPIISVAVLNPTGMFFNTGIELVDEPTPGKCNWPPRA